MICISEHLNKDIYMIDAYNVFHALKETCVVSPLHLHLTTLFLGVGSFLMSFLSFVLVH
jgi:hypothetical protein